MMRKIALVVLNLTMILTAVVFVSESSASAPDKLIEGTIRDTTQPEPCWPECASPSPACPQAGSCSPYPVYESEPTYVTVRRWHSMKVMTTAVAAAGHFEIRLAPGRYFLRAHPAEGSCRSGDAKRVSISGKLRGPVALDLGVHDSCAVPPLVAGSSGFLNVVAARGT